MVEIKVYSDIANKNSEVFMSMFGVEDSVFSADTVKSVFEKNQDEKDFKFNIHCNGGDVAEGLAIYDIIRNSGKTIHTNIDGSCHSMAITLLLAAPKENRTANKNARALIHEVRVFACDGLTGDELQALADDIKTEQNTILDIYAERTGHDRAELETLMKEEKQRTAEELLKYGFITKINQYSTNKQKQAMSKKKQDIVNTADSFLTKLKNFLNAAETLNYDFTDADGNVLFSTESETDTLEVGMPAAPDGTFELEDGRTVTIEEGLITAIDEQPQESEEVTNLRNRVEELEGMLNEANTVITDLRNQVQSNYVAKNRLNNPCKKQGKQMTASEKRNEAKEKMNKAKGGKQWQQR